jgi:hypothetical protein
MVPPRPLAGGPGVRGLPDRAGRQHRRRLATGRARAAARRFHRPGGGRAAAGRAARRRARAAAVQRRTRAGRTGAAGCRAGQQFRTRDLHQLAGYAARHSAARPGRRADRTDAGAGRVEGQGRPGPATHRRRAAAGAGCRAGAAARARAAVRAGAGGRCAHGRREPAGRAARVRLPPGAHLAAAVDRRLALREEAQGHLLAFRLGLHLLRAVRVLRRAGALPAQLRRLCALRGRHRRDGAGRPLRHRGAEPLPGAPEAGGRPARCRAPQRAEL